MKISRQETLSIKSEKDIARARVAAQRLTHELGFRERDQIRFMTAISELTRNVIKYGVTGSCDFFSIYSKKSSRIEAVIQDQGPGIADLSIAMQPGYSTKGTLGCGLSGTKKLMDEFHISSSHEGLSVFIAMNGQEI